MKFFYAAISTVVILTVGFYASNALGISKPLANDKSDKLFVQIPPLSAEVMERYKTVMTANLERHYIQFKSNTDRFAEYLKNNPNPDYRALANDQSHAFYSAYNQALFTAMNYDFAAACFRLASLHQGAESEMWRQRGKESAAWVRDHYIVPANGNIRGYLTLVKGQLFSAQAFATEAGAAKKAIKMLVDQQSFTSANTPPEENSQLRSTELSRETAYSIMNFIAAEKIGGSKSKRLDYLISCAKGHVKQWIDALKATGQTPASWIPVQSNDAYVRPFMVALTVGALQWYAQHRNDTAVLNDCGELLDLVWQSCWDDTARAFKYTDRTLPDDNPIRQLDKNDENLDIKPQPALNSIIGMAFARQGQLTGNKVMSTRADTIIGSHLDSSRTAKETNQSLFF